MEYVICVGGHLNTGGFHDRVIGQSGPCGCDLCQVTLATLEQLLALLKAVY